jgi:hypothetical protein
MLSAGKTSAQDLAVILSAGSIARERLSVRAAALVKKRWAEIEQLAASS